MTSASIPPEAVRLAVLIAGGIVFTLIATVAQLWTHRRGARGGRRRW